MPRLTALRAAGYRRMPWKNGGGVTAEIAVAPADAGLDDFLWRLSMAQVAQDGPFSSFPGIDRTLTLLEGGGMDLEIGAPSAPETVRLSVQSAPLSFPADVPTAARLVAGAITDFNVMTRRDRCRHTVTRQVVQGELSHSTHADVLVVFVCAGSLECEWDGERVTLDAQDCAVIERAGVSRRLASADGATALLVEFYLLATTGA